MIVRAMVVACAACALAACTSSAAPPAPVGTSTDTSTVTRTRLPDDRPIVAGRTTAAQAARCPLAAQPFVHDTIGMRLGRITVLRSGGRVVGCRFYAAQHSAQHASEHLPGPNQPVVEITTQRYRSATAAHNAFVLEARRGTNAQQMALGRVTGVCFQIDFYPPDYGQDWACAGSVGSREILVRTVDTTGTFNTVAITRAVLRSV